MNIGTLHLSRENPVVVHRNLPKIHISQFPWDVLEEIFGYLDGKSLINCKRVCRNWNLSIQYLGKKTKLWYRSCQNEIPSWEQVDILDNMFPSHWEDSYKVDWQEVYKSWCFWSCLDDSPFTINKLTHGLTKISSVQISGEYILITTKEDRGRLYAQRLSEERFSCIYACFGPILNFELVNSDVNLPSNIGHTSKVEEIFDTLEHEEVWLELEDCYIQLGKHYCNTINNVEGMDTSQEAEQQIRHSYGYELRIVTESLWFTSHLHLKKICATVDGPETMKINLPERYAMMLDFWNNTVTLGNISYPWRTILSSVTVNKASQESTLTNMMQLLSAYDDSNTYSWHGSLYILYSNRDVIIGKDGLKKNQSTPVEQGCVTSFLFYSKHLFVGTEKGMLLIYHVKAPEDCLNVVLYQTASWNIHVCHAAIIKVAIAESVHFQGRKPQILCATAEGVYMILMESLPSS